MLLNYDLFAAHSTSKSVTSQSFINEYFAQPMSEVYELRVNEMGCNPVKAAKIICSELPFV